ncbi:uncharacterized protein [Palaemon carinicauda]|uniref:uncharacterized protein n=1 Tax=Palaemon carinicauda TaxID=392227 RepID=UPI0035B68F6B
MRVQMAILLALGVSLTVADRKSFGIQLPVFQVEAARPQEYHIRPPQTGSSDYFIFGSPLGTGHAVDSPAGAVTRGEVSDIEAFSATFSHGFADLPEYDAFSTVPRMIFRTDDDDSHSEEDDDDDDK